MNDNLIYSGTNELGYTYYLDKNLTHWANRNLNEKEFLVFLVKNGDEEIGRVLVKYPENSIIGELKGNTLETQACEIDLLKFATNETN